MTTVWFSSSTLCVGVSLRGYAIWVVGHAYPWDNGGVRFGHRADDFARGWCSPCQPDAIHGEIKLRLIIAGSRTIPPEGYAAIDRAITKPHVITEIVSGKAKGADALGEKWANRHRIPIKQFPAQWEVYGRLAGRMRNRQMAQYGDALLAVWDGKSRGTGNMIFEMREVGKPVRILEWPCK